MSKPIKSKKVPKAKSDLEFMRKEIDDLGVAFLNLSHFIPITQNILVGLARYLKVSPVDFAKFINNAKENEDFENEVTKALEKLTGKNMKEINKNIVEERKI